MQRTVCPKAVASVKCKGKKVLIPEEGKTSHVDIPLLSFMKVTGLIRPIIHHSCVRTCRDVAILIKGLTVLKRK